MRSVTNDDKKPFSESFYSNEVPHMATGHKNEKTVLAIDDTPDNLLLVSELLLNAGYYVLTANNGRQGFEVAKRERPSLVMSDVSMPEVDGITLCRMIRADAELASTPLLLVSAFHKDTPSVLAGLRAGADDYIESPYDPLKLVAKVTRLIEVRHAVTELQESEQRFRLMADATPVMLWMSDSKKEGTYFNKRWLEFTGSSLEAELGNGWVKHVDPDDVQRCLETYHTAFDSRRDFRMEYRLRRFDGEYRWVLDIGVPRYTPEGRFAGYIGSCLDITRRRQAEDEIKRLNDELESRVAERTAQLQTANRELECEISERVLTELALSESDERFNAFMDNSPALAFVKREDGRYVYANHMFKQLTRKDWRERTDFDLWEEPVAKQLTKNDQTVLSTDKSFEVEEIIPILDGSHRHWWSFKFPLKDSAGRSYVAGVAVDITARKQMEDTLGVSEERYRRLVELSPETIIVHSEGKIVFINGAGAKFLGADGPEEVIGKPLVNFMHTDSQDIVMSPIGRSQIEQKPGELTEQQYVRLDGEVRDVEVIRVGITYLGKPAIEVIARDISERKRAERARKESEQRYYDLVENARDIIYTHDRTGRFTSLNKAGEQVTGYTREEVLTMNFADVVVPEHLEEARQMLSMKPAGGLPTIYELDILTKDRRRLTLEVNTRTIYENDTVVGMQGVARDVTERKLLEQQLRQSQKMESVGRLAGGIAHDFNNLLTVINGYSDLVITEFNEGDPIAQKVEEIRKAGRRASALTYQLLAFSRKQILQPKRVNINTIVTEIGKMLQRVIGEDVQLTTLLNPRIGVVKADPDQISQVIMNLAINARDAMPQGGELTIETANVRLDQQYVSRHVGAHVGIYVMLALRDTGCGMDADTQRHIFEPFFTTKESGRGTGLGLATVYGIIKQSLGYIEVESEVGLGTTFKIYLPLLEFEDYADFTDPENKSGALVPGTGTILLVEDEVGVRKLAREILISCGYEVLEAQSGEEAISICEREARGIDLLITDVVMPRMSGRELADRLSQLRPLLPVLYMSGHTDDAIVHHGLGEGTTNFIQKPFPLDALTSKVKEMLDARRKV